VKSRWYIAVLLSCAIAISYFDRQTLAVAVKAIQHDFPISNTDYSRLQAAFLLAYAIMYAAGGKVIDALGTRGGFLAIMVWWSLACASHGIAAGFGMLAGQPVSARYGRRRRISSGDESGRGVVLRR